MVALLGAQEALAQYCTPSTTSSTWRENQVARTTGALQNFNNVTGNARGYFDYSKTIGATVKAGTQIKITVNYYYGMGIWVDWNNDGTFTNSGAEKIFVRTNGAYAWGERTYNINVPANAVTGKKLRMRIMSGYWWRMNPCGYSSSYQTDVEDYYIFVTYDNNAGVTKMTNPQAECNGSAGTAVDILFQNTGAKSLDTLYFGGKIIDKASGSTTAIPTKMWSGSLQSGQTVKNPFNVYNHTFNLKAGDSICVWSFNPNNVPDSAASDDTLCFEVLKGMKGLFTVGDTTGGAHDFRTLKDAVDSINLAGAICDSVIIELHDTSWSTYKDQYYLRSIIGTSPTSPIIFRPESHNMYQTRVWFDSLTEDYNHVFLLDDISDVYFEGINFSAASGRSTGYETNIQVKNSDRINFIKCSFTNTQSARNDKDYDLISASDGDGLTITECNFTNGSSSISVENSNNIHISKGTFREMYNSGVNIASSDNVVVMRSSFTSASFYTNGIAISLSEVNNSVELSYNTVNVAKNQWPRYGVAMDNCNALNSSSEVYNNMINVGQPWSSILFQGIRLNNVVGTSVAFNTSAVSGNNASNTALYSNGGTRNTAFNNVLAAMISGFSIHTPVAASIVSGDHNNVYSAGGTVGRLGSSTSNTLSAWQSATGLDVNSVSVNPFFYKLKANDLHVCNDKMFQAAKSIASITDDWDGDKRDPNKPCIGADEFAPVSQFSLGNAYGLCDGDTTYLVAGKGLTGEIAIWKDGSGSVIDTSQTLTVTSPGKYDVTLLNACGVNADSIEIIAPAKVALANDTNICPGKTVNVDATIVNGQNYMWSDGRTSATITVSNPGTYFVTSTDKWTCVSSDSIVVTYSNTADLSSGDTIVCQGAPFGLFGGTSIAEPNVSYKWFGFKDADLETGDNVFVDYDFLLSQDTTVTVELTHRGCVTRDSIKVSKKPAPKIDGLTFFTNGLGLYITGNTSTGANHGWDFGDTNTSTWSAPRHLYTTNGTYTVKYTNSNICGAVDTTFEVSIFGVGLDENNRNRNLSIYPNPNNGNFNIQLNDINAENASIKIMDARGREVLYKELGQIAGSTNETISLSQAGAGVYLIHLNLDGVIQLAKITIE